jgi:mRNA interferase RelE/StbE
MQIETKNSFIKDLKSIPKDVRTQIATLIQTMENAEKISDLPAMKKLKGYENFYRIRIGDYRLGFAIINDVIVLVRFLHRKEIYRFFSIELLAAT